MRESPVKGNLARLHDQIVAAAARSNRDPAAITLVAVTKTHPAEAVLSAYEAGVRHFGENRVEEALPKQAELAGLLPADAVWHMIGHIQSRKTADVAGNFGWVHSVDRFKIARRLSEAAVGANRVLDILLEVNVSGEESKEGYDLNGWPRVPLVDTLLYADIERIQALPALRLRGLMTMAPFVPDPETVRPVFHRLMALSQALGAAFPAADFSELSMGMSGDFQVAIEEGATMVRVGTAIFGPREY